MRLSIVTINLNNATGLRKTISSVLDQSFEDFEFIVIDGGSTDSSIDVVKEIEPRFIEKKIRFRWTSEPDKGVFDAMNKGINMSSGDYVQFLNSGDLFTNGSALADSIGLNLPFDIIIGRCNVTDNGQIVYSTPCWKDITLGTLLKGSLPHQSMFFRKALFDDYGLYDSKLRFMGDWEFCIRVLIENNVTYHSVDTIVCDYNLDGISSQPDNFPLMDEERRKVLKSYDSLCRILPDYQTVEEYKREMAVAQWAMDKKLIRFVISSLYNLASKLSRWK